MRPAPPPPPPPPPPPEKSVTGRLRYNETYWRATIEEGARRYGIAVPPAGELAQPMPYFVELDAPRRLKSDREVLETPHLHLATKVVKEWATTADGEGFRYEHMVLDITNKSAHPVAYRVETAVEHPERCSSKGAIQHNAIALEPNETAHRTECLWRPGATLTVKRIEVLEVPELSYFYLSRLQPSQVLLDERTAAGHEPPKGAKTCQFVPWREIQAPSDGGKASWADVMDFYARHDCAEYSYWRGYRRWTQAGALPAKPPESLQQAPDGGAAR
jgi:hypothetical protein